MKLSEMVEAIASKRKWAVGWVLMNSIVCGLTMIALSRWGPLSFDDTSAFLLGFCVPMVVYTIKEVMGIYKYRFPKPTQSETFESATDIRFLIHRSRFSIHPKGVSRSLTSSPQAVYVPGKLTV